MGPSIALEVNPEEEGLAMKVLASTVCSWEEGRRCDHNQRSNPTKSYPFTPLAPRSFTSNQQALSSYLEFRAPQVCEDWETGKHNSWQRLTHTIRPRG